MKLIVRAFLIVVFSIGLVYANSDSKAGYRDGCSSARGHYTRSNYKYKNSWEYKANWRKGKKACTKYKRKHHRYHRHHKVARKCFARPAWVLFRMGYDRGYAAARAGRKIRRISGCLEYRRGWLAGYRACRCPKSIN